jgi:hypothetical protein
MTTPFTPGQAIIGSRVETAPMVFSQPVTQQQTPHSGGTAPKVTAWASNSGTGASIGAVTGYDMAGNFAITAGTGSLAGTMCTVTFGRPLAASPVAVNVSVADTTAGAATNPVVGALALSKTGWALYSGTNLTLNHVYLISYQVWQ